MTNGSGQHPAASTRGSSELLSDATGMPVIFVSHSRVDAPLAEALARLLQRALSLRSEQIRCSSVTGFAFPVSTDFDGQLPREIAECRLFIALLTPSSARAPYVLLEAGARWASGGPLAPVTAGGFTLDGFPGPLADRHALKLDDASHVFQLVSDAARFIGQDSALPESLDTDVRKLVSAAVVREVRGPEAADPSCISLSRQARFLCC